MLYQGEIPRVGEVIDGVIQEVRLFAEGEPEWFILFAARSDPYEGLLIWSDSIDFHEGWSSVTGSLVGALNAIGKYGDEGYSLPDMFRHTENKYMGDEVTRVTTLGPGAKLVGSPIAVEVNRKANGRPGIERFRPPSDEVLSERRASRIADLDAEIYEGKPARPTGRRAAARVEKYAGVIEYVRSNPGKTRTEVAHALGGNRNSRFAMIKELLAADRLVERDSKLYVPA